VAVIKLENETRKRRDNNHHHNCTESVFGTVGLILLLASVWQLAVETTTEDNIAIPYAS
jgi:hypothetical protein